MSVIIFYNCQIDAIKIKGKGSCKKSFPEPKLFIRNYFLVGIPPFPIQDKTTNVGENFLLFSRPSLTL